MPTAASVPGMMSPTLGPQRRPPLSGVPGDADEAAHRLRDDVVGRQVGVWAGAGARVAEAADGGVDEARVALRAASRRRDRGAP